MSKSVRLLKPCGTYAAYKRGCRCFRCRVALSCYMRDLYARRKAHTLNHAVSTELVLAHMDYLRSHGVGLRSISDCTGITRDHLQDIKNGRVKRVLQTTEERIMRVSPDVKPGGARIDARRAHRIVARLLKDGWTKAEIAIEIGMGSPALKWWGKKRITLNTLLRLEKFCSEKKAA